MRLNGIRKSRRTSTNWSKGAQFKCGQCPYKARRECLLAAHKMNEHLARTDKWKQCDECPFKARKFSRLKNHKIAKHLKESEIEWFLCGYCSYKGKFKHSLKRHVLRRHPSKKYFEGNKSSPAVFKCDKCPNQFQWKKNLQLHVMAKHGTTNSKWYKCDQCTFKTNHSWNLAQHQVHVHREVSSDDWRQCKFCIYKTKFRQNLSRHVLQKHPKGAQLINKKSKVEIRPKASSPVKPKEENSIATPSTEDTKWHLCDLCSYKTKYVGNLNKHQSCKHFKNDKTDCFPCSLCPYKAKFRYNLTTHMKTHSQTSQSNTTSNKVKAENLIVTRSNGDSKWHECDQCGYKAKLYSDLREHKSRQHVTVKGEWLNCKLCPYKSKLRRSFWSHLKKHRKPELQEPPTTIIKSEEDLTPMPKLSKPSKLYECEKCSYRFPGKVSLKRHMTSKHTNEKKFTWFNCDQCPYKTKFIKDLHFHKICQHLKDDEIDWFQCKYCEYKTKLEKLLRRHTLKHHPTKAVEYMKQRQKDCAKTYPCDQCPAIFQGEISFKRHVDTKHVLKCEFCAYKTNLNSLLKRHVLKNHKVKVSSNDAKGLSCSECLVVFKTSAILKRHVIEQHTDEKDIVWFECDSCPYRSKRRGGLFAHVRNRHPGNSIKY